MAIPICLAYFSGPRQARVRLDASNAGMFRSKHTGTQNMSSKQSRPTDNGYRATRHVAQGGKLPDQYRPAARKYLLVICSLTLVLGLTPTLYRRLVLHEEPKKALRIT